MFHRVIMQDGADATGVGTAIELIGQDGCFDNVGIQVSGTFVGTVTFQGTVDGSNWSGIEMTDASDRSDATTTTGEGIFTLETNGLAAVRANVTAYTSGAIDVVGIAK